MRSRSLSKWTLPTPRVRSTHQRKRVALLVPKRLPYPFVVIATTEALRRAGGRLAGIILRARHSFGLSHHSGYRRLVLSPARLPDHLSSHLGFFRIEILDYNEVGAILVVVVQVRAIPQSSSAGRRNAAPLSASPSTGAVCKARDSNFRLVAHFQNKASRPRGRLPLLSRSSNCRSDYDPTPPLSEAGSVISQFCTFLTICKAPYHSPPHRT